VSEAAAERAEALGEGEPAGLARRPRFRGRTAAAEHAARALFESTVGAPGDAVRRPSGEGDAEAPGPPAEIAISISELRQRVALQSGQLARAMEEVEVVNRRLRATRLRAASAETGAARERAMRVRHSGDAARRLLEHHRTIADLAGRVDAERRAAAAGRARIALLEGRLEARVGMEGSVTRVITRARDAIVEVRAELARAGQRAEHLESALAGERRVRSALERRLEEVTRDAQATRLGASAPGPQAAAWADVATACRRLEQELASRDALEVKAASLIASLNQHFNAVR
jgi:chromosome segregation ATPase